MPLLKEEAYTIDDIYALPDGERAELIDGRMYMMAPPSRKHQRISTRLVSIIDRYIEEHKGKCEVYAAPFAVYLDERSNTYVEPDISVICDPDKLDDRGCKGAPDWIIEIVSPASKKMDYLLKLLKYRFAGVKEYWIVDPEKNRVIVYNFTGDESVNDYTLQDFVKVGIYEDFVIDFGSMSDNMTKRAKEYMNADFVYEDYKNLAEAQKIADVEDVTAISERLIKQNMEAYKELAK